MIDVIAARKMLIPCQDSNLGSINITAVLFKKKEIYNCAIGIGDNYWVADNGILLTWDEANQYIAINLNLKKHWGYKKEL